MKGLIFDYTNKTAESVYFKFENIELSLLFNENSEV